MKRLSIFLSVLLCLTPLCRADEPIYLDKYNTVCSPQTAMDCLEGSWSGQQNIFLPDGKLLMTFNVFQEYHWTLENGEKLMRSTGEIMTYGERINISIALYDRKDHILLEMKDAEGNISKYKGYTVKGQTVWIPSPIFLLPDIQSDMFYPSEDKVELFSQNVKTVAGGRGFSGVLVVKTLLSKKRQKEDFAAKKKTGAKDGKRRGFFLRGKGTLFE